MVRGVYPCRAAIREPHSTWNTGGRATGVDILVVWHADRRILARPQRGLKEQLHIHKMTPVHDLSITVQRWSALSTCFLQEEASFEFGALCGEVGNAQRGKT